ncbi:UDP-glucose dehydrogenase family protein [Rickettsia endosymbiont of Halotydeus destructor]|uniref:UDP-glucose dehydrogenase family protein n=1 Tax=Rickettsia endosymbiont of Halotydeus destructor TaxID=2996754 RepID=UPI003BB079A4
MNITFIGCGYVGLVSGTVMSHLGHNVVCLDTDQTKIAKLNSGISPIYETDLDKYLQQSIKSERLKFTYNYDAELATAEAVFITVGTPSLPSGEADLTYVFDVIDKICNWISKDCLLVIKSTVPPTSCNKIIDYLAEKNFTFNVASNPEFLREGTAVKDFLAPDRIIVGVNNKKSEEIIRKIYLPLIDQNIPLVVTDLVTSELIKYASNSFLATKISYINEMANLCEKTGANIKDLAFGMGLDQRIGAQFLNAGPGFGGSCFPKDILALRALAENYQTDCKILDAVIDSNRGRPFKMVDKISNLLGNELSGKNITILGLTYKAGTDDIRDSPAIEIIKNLLIKGAYIKAFDPVGLDNAQKYFENENLLYLKSAIEACAQADAIVITTEWLEFNELDWIVIYKSVKSPIIIDLRNLLDAETVKAAGFEYYGIGRGG